MPRALARRVGVILSLVAALAAGTARAATFGVLATHPDAAAQPTVTGRTLSTLKVFNNKIYVGYGDYNANTGPIQIRAYDFSTAAFTPSMLSMLTEHVLLFREIGGKLYSPIIDTSAGGGGGTGYAVGTPSGANETWQNLLPVGGIHMFDINSLDGTSLMMTGAVTAPTYAPTAWYSPDGTSWSTSHTETPPADHFGRYYGLGKYQGKLWTEARYAGLTAANSTSRINPPYSNVWDGTSWSQGPQLLPGDAQTVWRPEEFAGQMVYLTLHNGFQTSRMFKFNGTAASQAYVDPTVGATSLFRDYAVAGDYLYGLLADGRLLQTRDLTTWSVFDTAPANSRSLTVFDGNLYIGTENAQILTYSAKVPEAFLIGDLDGNGQVDNFDIQPFELALTDPVAYAAEHPAVVDFRERGDLDGDGDFDNFDIQPFEDLLTSSPTMAAVPEPPAVVLLGCGLALAGVALCRAPSRSEAGPRVRRRALTS